MFVKIKQVRNLFDTKLNLEFTISFLYCALLL